MYHTNWPDLVLVQHMGAICCFQRYFAMLCSVMLADYFAQADTIELTDATKSSLLQAACPATLQPEP